MACISGSSSQNVNSNDDLSVLATDRHSQSPKSFFKREMKMRKGERRKTRSHRFSPNSSWRSNVDPFQNQRRKFPNSSFDERAVPTAMPSNMLRLRKLANKALQDLFESTKGQEWYNSDEWLAVGSEVKLWYGAVVEREMLLELNLIRNGMDGHLLPSIGQLFTIRQLDLSFNKNLRGNLPEEIGHLRSLKILKLCGCSFEGLLPETIGNLVELRELKLSGNRFCGGLPKNLSNLVRLRELCLNSNDFTGKIPVSLSQLVSIRVLDLSDNHMTGSIPDQLGALISLKTLKLDGNAFKSPLPKAESGPELQLWLHRRITAYAISLQKKLKCIQQDKDEEVIQLSLNLERSGQKNASLEKKLEELNERFRRLERTREEIEHPPASPEIKLSKSANSDNELFMMNCRSDLFCRKLSHNSSGRSKSGVCGEVIRGDGLVRHSSNDTEEAKRLNHNSATTNPKLKQFGLLNKIRSAFDIATPKYGNEAKNNKKNFGLKIEPNLSTASEGKLSQKTPKSKWMASLVDRRHRSADQLFESERKACTEEEISLVRGFLRPEDARVPDLAEVLLDLALEPFDLASFRKWAKNNFIDENIDFLFDVEALQCAPTSKAAAEARFINNTYVCPGSEMEVSISSNGRMQTVYKVNGLLKEYGMRLFELAPVPSSASVAAASTHSKSLTSVLRACGLDSNLLAQDEKLSDIVNDLKEGFLAAQNEVMEFLRKECFPKFVHDIHCQLQNSIRKESISSVDYELVQSVVRFCKSPKVEVTETERYDARLALIKDRRNDKKIPTAKFLEQRHKYNPTFKESFNSELSTQ